MADSWLIRDGMDRERMLDMDRRINPLRTAALGVLGMTLVIGTPWMGARTIAGLLIAVLTAGVFFKVAAARAESFEKPEYVLFAGWFGAEVLIAVCIIITGGATSPALAWMAIPVVTLSARFSTRGVIVGVTTTLGLLIIAIVSRNFGTVIDDPMYAGASLAMVLSVAILSAALMLSDVEHRTEAVIDPLTGLLNRTALRNRTNELAQRSAYSAEPVGVIVADIDRFKDINDRFGHAVGDAVLKDIAYVMRRELRAFDLAYRIGGEEFLVLLPGANSEEAKEFADELHRVLGAAPRGGHDVTVSFGVSASRYGDIFDYDKVFEHADAALYLAKNSGRNQVRVADEEKSVAGAGGGFAPHAAHMS
ncbi:MAG: GGDEF domain-containing protein [Thermoleophilaceae bacterium]|nr:GGDEF domain-containing protein [Thermoleophilaceae bacterium]